MLAVLIHDARCARVVNYNHSTLGGICVYIGQHPTRQQIPQETFGHTAHHHLYCAERWAFCNGGSESHYSVDAASAAVAVAVSSSSVLAATTSTLRSYCWSSPAMQSLIKYTVSEWRPGVSGAGNSRSCVVPPRPICKQKPTKGNNNKTKEEEDEKQESNTATCQRTK